MRELVVNADDFGLTAGVSRGVARAFDRGILSSASLLANMPGFDEAIRVARKRPSLSVGLHLNLTEGNPVSAPEQVKSLVDSSGSFYSYRSFSLRLLSGRINREELRAEVLAQLARLRDAGIAVSHIDGHRHIHLLPLFFDLVATIAEEQGIAYVRCPAASGEGGGATGVAAARSLGLVGFGRLHQGKLSEHGLQSADAFLGAAFRANPKVLPEARSRLGELPAGLTEWMVHPGEVDAGLVFVDDYLWKRGEELAFLCEAKTLQAVQEHGLRLVNFRGEPKLAVQSSPR